MKKNSIIAGLCLLALPMSVFAGDFLSGEQIKSAISGKTVQWEHMFKSKSGMTYYSADGTITGVQNGNKREGTWHVDGDKLCVSWGKCLAIEPDGNGGYYKVKGGSKRVVHIKSVSDGNTL